MSALLKIHWGGETVVSGLPDEWRADQDARRLVSCHDSGSDAAAALACRVQADDPRHALVDEPQRPRLRIVVAVARVAQHEDRRLTVERVELGLREPAEGKSNLR